MAEPFLPSGTEITKAELFVDGKWVDVTPIAQGAAPASPADYRVMMKAVRGNDSETLHLPVDAWGNLWCGEKIAPELAVLEVVDVRDVCAVCKTSKLEAKRSGR